MQSYASAAFRTDLEIVPTTIKGGLRRYCIKDPVSGKTFELGEEEHFLCTLIDGRRSLSEIRSRFESRFNLSLDMEQLKAFVRQLEREGLLFGCTERSVSAFDVLSSPDTWHKWYLFNPARVLSWLDVKLRWCFTRPFKAACAIVFLLALGVLFNDYLIFLRELKLYFSNFTWGSRLKIFATYYLCFNIPVEMLRGVTGLRYGGRSDWFGIRLVFDLLPAFFCRVDFSQIGKKSERARALFVPICYPFLVAGLGVLLWKMTAPRLALHDFGRILAAMGIVKGFLRLNVLWPTDASVLLANWLDAPMFRKRSMEVAKSVIFRLPPPEPLALRDRIIFKWYGILAGVATVSTVIAVVYFFSDLLIYRYDGIGALILLSSVTLVFRKSLLRFLKPRNFLKNIFFTKNGEGSMKKRYRWFVYAGIVVLMFIPYPYETGGAFTLLPIKHVEVHTQVAGVIKEVKVKEGDWVEEGQVIAVLDTREHQKNLDVVTANLEKARADLRLLEAGPKKEEVEKARQQVIAAEKRYAYSKREADRLKALFKGGVVSEEEYMSAAKTADIDRENLELAKDNLELVMAGARPEEIEAQRAVVRDLETRLQYYKENLSLCTIVAPTAGQIVTPYIDKKVGQVLSEGDLVAVIEDARTIQAEILVQESDIGMFEHGARVKIRPWAYPTKFFYGKVVSVAPSAENAPDGKVVRVLSEIENLDFKLLSDMTGEAKIAGGWKPLIVAFSRAIVRFFMVEVWSWFP